MGQVPEIKLKTDFKMAAKNRNFNGLSPTRGRYASTCQILSKSIKRLRRYGNSTVFQNGGRLPSWNSRVRTWTTHDEHYGGFTVMPNICLESMQYF